MSKQSKLIEPVANEFNVYEIYEMGSGDNREIIFETAKYNIDALVVFKVHSILEEGGCADEVLRIITEVDIDIAILKVWTKDGERLQLTEKESKRVLNLMYENLENEIKEFIIT